MNDIIRCPHCETRMVATAAGCCPACGRDLSQPKLVPPPPPPPPRRHPLLVSVCLILIGWGLGRFAHRQVQTLEEVTVDLALLWTGTMGIVAISLWRMAERRRLQRGSGHPTP